MIDRTAAPSPTRDLAAQIGLLVGGIGGLVAAHRVASALDTGIATLGIAVLVAASLAAVVRATVVIVGDELAGARRVFRSRRLIACAAWMGFAAVLAGVSVVHGPFDRVLAHGRITGDDIADLGSVLATFACMVGAAVAAVGAAEALHDERHWDRSLRREPSG